MLPPNECYRAIREVAVGEAVASLERCRFVAVNHGQQLPHGYPCDVVLADKFPTELRELVAGLALGGETVRAVLRRLPPHTDIPPHTDTWMGERSDWSRFQLPLVTDPLIMMEWPDDNVSTHLSVGTLYEVRFDRTHAVRHRADCARIHLQIDQVGATV